MSQMTLVRSRPTKVAHVLERVGLSLAGASGGLFVAAHSVKTGVEALTSPGAIFAMMIFGAVGFYLGIDLPPEASAGDQTNASDTNASDTNASHHGFVARTDWAEFLSAAGTFLAALAAFVAVFSIVADSDSQATSPLVVLGVCLVG